MGYLIWLDISYLIFGFFLIFFIMRCVHGPCIAALHVLIALTVLGCVHVCLRLIVGVGLSSICMFHVLILMFILV